MNDFWRRVRALVLFGWLVALIRLGLDATIKPERSDVAFWFGVYELMPVAFLVAGIRGSFDGVRWGRLALVAVILGALVWGLPNLITYTTAQFQGWTHGRFAPPPNTEAIAPTAMGKITRGLIMAGITTVAGTIASLIGLTLFVWLPGLVRSKRRAQRPDGGVDSAGLEVSP